MLKTQYAGLELKNPIIAASSGLTDNVEKIVALEKAGVGAVVLKSLFEEQLAAQSEHLLNSSDSDYPEAYDYLQNIVKAHEVEKYLTLIREARKVVSIPVIASINCYDDGSWESFAADLEKAGASAMELNVQKINPTTEYRPGTIGKLHVEILQKVEAAVHIPVTVKISRNLSNLVSVVDQLRAAGAAGVVLFNRPWQPDIDIHNRRLVAGSPFSTSADLSDTLRWLGIVSGQVNKLPLAASTACIRPKTLSKSFWPELPQPNYARLCISTARPLSGKCSTSSPAGSKSKGSLLLKRLSAHSITEIFPMSLTTNGYSSYANIGRPAIIADITYPTFRNISRHESFHVGSGPHKQIFLCQPQIIPQRHSRDYYSPTSIPLSMENRYRSIN